MPEQSHRERIRQADLHTCAVQSWLSSRAPTAARINGIGVDAQSTGYQIPLLNLALSKGYPIGTPPQIITHEIERIKAFYTNRNVPWSWWVGPDHHPAQLHSHLEQCGLVCDRPALPAMAVNLPVTLPAVIEKQNPDTKVWLAKSHFDLKAASHIRHTAFGFPKGTGEDYFEAMANDWLAGKPARLYLARVGDGEPASMGAMIMGNGVPGVYVMATLPEWRRRGLGKAILRHILLEATEAGHNFMVLTASRIGFLLYQQFGFEPIFDYQIYKVK